MTNRAAIENEIISTVKNMDPREFVRFSMAFARGYDIQHQVSCESVCGHERRSVDECEDDCVERCNAFLDRMVDDA